MLVNTKSVGVVVPKGHDSNGKMVLNISSSATVGRTINNEAIIFKARFQGKSQKIVVPCNAVLSIYAHENGEGMMFDMPKSDQEKNDKKPSLKILD